MCGFVNAPPLDALEQLEHIHRAELGDGTRTDVREHQRFKGPYGFSERGWRQLLLLQRQPFARDRFERIRGRQLLGLPLAAGIHTGSELPARRVAALARLFQLCVGMGARGEAVLSAIVAVLEAPQLAPGRGYLQGIGRDHRTACKTSRAASRRVLQCPSTWGHGPSVE
jgi:hypothetical protein